MIAKRGRWCASDRGYVPTVLAVRFGRRLHLCQWCARPTQANKPRTPKSQAADRKWSRDARDGINGQRCEACSTKGWPGWRDCQGVSDAAHVKAKGAHPALRHHQKNRVGLCRPSHTWFTGHTAAWREWLSKHRPGLLEELREAAR